MTREEIGRLFNKYLYRNFTEKEFDIHGKKDFDLFEEEISKCRERNEILSRDGRKLGKIAFLITGHIRKNSILEGILRLCQGYDIDTYIHTWSNIGLKGAETNLNDKVNIQAVEAQINKLPNVKKYEIENNKDYINNLKKTTNYFNYSSPEPFIKSQLYSINKAFSYLENEVTINNTHYDAVFKFRFDSDIFSFNLTKGMIEDINNHDILFVPNKDNQHSHPDYGTSCWACDNMYYNHKLKDVHVFEHTNIVCDLFAYGSFKSMREYCSLYNHYDDMNNKYYEQNVELSKKHKKNYNIDNKDYKFKNQNGHIDSLYYFYCSYPERMFQLHLKNYMLIESRNIKLKLVR